mgnify:CR=1 FL=1
MWQQDTFVNGYPYWTNNESSFGIWHARVGTNKIWPNRLGSTHWGFGPLSDLGKAKYDELNMIASRDSSFNPWEVTDWYTNKYTNMYYSYEELNEEDHITIERAEANRWISMEDCLCLAARGTNI